MATFPPPGFARHDVPFEIPISKSKKFLPSLLRRRLLQGAITLVIGLVLLLAPAVLLPQTSNNLAFVSKITPSALRYSEITGTGDLAIIGGLSSNSFVWIYAGDIGAGLYVLKFAEHQAANFNGQVVDAAANAPISGPVIYFRDEYPTKG